MQFLFGQIPVISSVVFVVVVTMFARLFPRKIEMLVELLLVIAMVLYLFFLFPTSEAMLLMGYLSISYGLFGVLFERGKLEKRKELAMKLQTLQASEVEMIKNPKRVIMDYMLTVIVIIGAVIFIYVASETYALLKFLTSIMLINVVIQMVKRTGHYVTTKIYWVEEEDKVLILSYFESRELPLKDLKGIYIESTVDLLKLHPLFTFIASQQDYTSSFSRVVKLTFPGENIYFTPRNLTFWSGLYERQMKADEIVRHVDIFPLWHPKVLKRLFWKGYFAITVKGVSAYTGLLVLLLWLEVSTPIWVATILCWWFVNLYLSDRVLIAATDAVEIRDGEVFENAQQIFEKANIPKTKLYYFDSPVHNGLATGMNIGRGAVLLTKATLEMSIESIEAIIAHEAIHIKKRDVFMIQVARLLFIGAIAGTSYVFYDELLLLMDYPILLFCLIYVLMIAFPLYLSLISQYAENRADALGARLVNGGRLQMSYGLHELGTELDEAVEKGQQYGNSVQEVRKERARNVERSEWLIRLIEFQMMAHPPLYWRIAILERQLTWKQTIYIWLKERVMESLPIKQRIS